MVESEFGLGNGVGPQAHGEVLVGAAPSRYEVSFGGADGAFRCISSVIVRWNKLVFDVFLFHEIC